MIKQALVHAFNNEKYEDIRMATQGLVFFATPHNGARGSLVSIGKAAAKITSSLGAREGDNIVEIMNKDSMFSDLVNDLYRQRLLDYPIVSFWGTFDKVRRDQQTPFSHEQDYSHGIDRDEREFFLWSARRAREHRTVGCRSPWGVQIWTPPGRPR